MKKLYVVFLVLLSLLVYDVSFATVFRTSDSDDIKVITKHLTSAQIFALAMFGETRGESERGKIAMGTITLKEVDRLKSKNIKNPLRRVCLKPAFFSSFNSDDPNFPLIKKVALNWNYYMKRSYSLKHCYLIATSMLDGTLSRDRLLEESNATNFMTVGYQSSWSKKMKVVAVIGKHQFFAKHEAIRI